MALHNTTTTEEFTKLIENGRPVLVDFWAEWCPPCHMMAPHLEKIARDNDAVDIVKVNIEQSDDKRNLAMKYQVQSIPNMQLFKDAKVIDQYIGVTPASVIEDALKTAAK